MSRIPITVAFALVFTSVSPFIFAQDRAAARTNAAAAALMTLGAGVYETKDGFHVTISRSGSLGRYNGWRGSDDDLTRLTELPRVYHLQIELKEPAELAFLERINGLKVLQLVLIGQLAHDALESLARCRQLTSLSVMAFRADPTVFRPLADIPNLESVQIAVLRLDQTVVDHISKNERVQSLRLGGISLDKASSHKLGQMPNLQELWIMGAGMSTEGVEAFRRNNKTACLWQKAGAGGAWEKLSPRD